MKTIEVTVTTPGEVHIVDADLLPGMKLHLMLDTSVNDPARMLRGIPFHYERPYDPAEDPDEWFTL